MEKKSDPKSTGKLRQCILGFGIPTSKAAFFTDQERDDKDYARNFSGVWHRYYHTVIRAVQRVEPYLLSSGVRVIHDLGLKDFGNLLRYQEVRVLILFSHWRKYKGGQDIEDEVEFSDGLASISKVIEEIPRNYAGIIDLCVCHPAQLADRLRRERPMVVVKSVPGKATPYIWLYYYLAVFKQMHIENVTYMKAFEEVFKAFFKYQEEGKEGR